MVLREPPTVSAICGNNPAQECAQQVLGPAPGPRPAFRSRNLHFPLRSVAQAGPLQLAVRQLDAAGPRPVVTNIAFGLKGRLHDTRHTLITELAESGAGDETSPGRVSRQMLRHYSHIQICATKVWKPSGESKRKR